jgi:uncharacterized membrane protein YhaH (DUF805 family)
VDSEDFGHHIELFDAVGRISVYGGHVEMAMKKVLITALTANMVTSDAAPITPMMTVMSWFWFMLLVTALPNHSVSARRLDETGISRPEP